MNSAEAEATLIANGFEPSLIHGDRWSFLCSFSSGDVEVAEAFLTLGVPLCEEGDSTSAVMEAVEGNRPDLLQLALRHGGSPETRNRWSGDTVLHVAVSRGFKEIIEELVRAGASPNALDASGQSPLARAVDAGKQEQVAQLLALGADPAVGTPSAIELAKSPDVLEKLLEAGADADARVSSPLRNTLLLKHVVEDNAAAVTSLLAHGARDEENAVGWTAWMVAKASDKGALCELLEAHGAPARDDWELPLHRAKTAADVSAAVASGHALDRFDWNGTTPLVEAIVRVKSEVVRALLDAGADVTVASPLGRGPVASAAAAGNLELVDDLLRRGASPNEGTGRDGKPRSAALMDAATHGYVEVVERLIEAGVALESEDEKGGTAVRRAAGKGHVRVLDALLRRGADPRGGSASESAIEHAMTLSSPCFVRLVEAGAWNDTLVMKVAERGRREAMAALLAAGADVRSAGEGESPFAAALRMRSASVEAFDAHLRKELLDRHTQDGQTRWAAVVAEMNEEHLRAFVHAGDVASVRALLDAGLAPSLFSEGRPPVLFDAVTHPDLFELALERGADPNVKNRFGSLLRHAAEHGGARQVSKLLALGADPNAHVNGDTALMNAANAEVAKLLVDAGAHVNPVRAGRTPLLRAVVAGDVERVAFLLSVGADKSIVGPGKRDALAVAEAHRTKAMSTAMVSLLSGEPSVAFPRFAEVFGLKKPKRLEDVDAWLTRGDDEAFGRLAGKASKKAGDWSALGRHGEELKTDAALERGLRLMKTVRDEPQLVEWLSQSDARWIAAYLRMREAETEPCRSNASPSSERPLDGAELERELLVRVLRSFDPSDPRFAACFRPKTNQNALAMKLMEGLDSKVRDEQHGVRPRLIRWLGPVVVVYELGSGSKCHFFADAAEANAFVASLPPVVVRGSLSQRPGVVSVWVDTDLDPKGTSNGKGGPVGSFDQDFWESERGDLPAQMGRFSRAASFAEAVLAQAASFGITGERSISMLYDHAYSTKAGLMHKGGGWFLGTFAV